MSFNPDSDANYQTYLKLRNSLSSESRRGVRPGWIKYACAQASASPQQASVHLRR